MTAGARLTDPDTSQAAAESMVEVLRPEHELVLEAIDFIHTFNGGHGATSYEIHKRLRTLGIERDQNCVASRCSEMHDREGFALHAIEDRGIRRPGRSRRQLIAWFPIENGDH